MMTHVAARMLAAIRTLQSERGATAVEYSIVASLIAAVIVTAVFAVGGATTRLFDLTVQAIPW